MVSYKNELEFEIEHRSGEPLEMMELTDSELEEVQGAGGDHHHHHRHRRWHRRFRRRHDRVIVIYVFDSDDFDRWD